MPNKEIMTEWIKRLRSGEYTQGQGFLASIEGDQTKHCCLGVLCEMAVEAGIAEKERGQSFYRFATPGNALTGSALLPTAVAVWAGFEATEPDAQDVILARNGATVRASGMNDAGASFAEIADLIEQNFLKEETHDSK